MNRLKTVRMLIGGQHASGKSTLAVTLYRILSEQHGLSVGLHELDIHSDTHDPLLGRKPWSARTKRWPLPLEAPPDKPRKAGRQHKDQIPAQ